MKADAQRQRGQVLVVAALFMVVLLVSAALAVDYGSWLANRRDFQSVVDAASLAGAAKLPPPGSEVVPVSRQQAAAVEALVYLNDHLRWGHDRTWAEGQVGSALNQTAPLVVDSATGQYCVWIWTPTPTTAVATTGSAACQQQPGDKLHGNGLFPNDRNKVFVRLESPRSTYFAGVAGFGPRGISAIAVAGGSHLNYAVIALKPRLSAADTNLGMKLSGTNTTLTVPRGDVGGNFSLRWGGGGSSVIFTPDFNQVVDLAEPGSVASNGSVVNGRINQLEDYPIEDPKYGTPAACAGDFSSHCWNAWPPTSDSGGGNGVYPACASNNDMNRHQLDFGCLSAAELAAGVSIWPGKYELVKLPAGTRATLMPDCFSEDPACSDPNGDGDTSDSRAGVFYLASTSSNSGLYLNGTPGNPTLLTGCGVLLIFDPYETGGSRIQFNAAGTGNAVDINAPDATNSVTCNMKSEPTNPNPPPPVSEFRWYGYAAADFTNPISIWVRPTGAGYNLTSPSGSGSNVITLGAGTTINEDGVIYAPDDNTKVSGGPNGSGVGQIVAWTIEYVGNSNITESFQGPAKIRGRLYQ